MLFRSDVIVVVAYGQILSQEILDISPFGCINVHASLLPKYRGAAPINWALANGEKQTGVTTMLMDAGIDTGDMLLNSVVDIDPDMNAEQLHDRLATLGADLLIETLNQLEQKTIVPIKQDDALACYAPLMQKETARIKWHLSAEEIHNHVRAFNPWPIAHTQFQEVVLKVFRTEVSDMDYDLSHPVGTVVKTDKNGIYVKTGHGLICIKELQWGSGKRMSAQSFLLGKSIENGTILL